MVVEHKPTVSMAVTTMKFKNMGKMVRSTLLRAKSQKRIIFGLSEAIKMLSKKPNESLFCFLAPVKNDDSATHMHEVLLQAFCLENDIYIIKVDTAEKLSRILRSTTLESCVLVQRAWMGDNATDATNHTHAENAIIDYCEEYWESPQQPIVKLPEK